MLTAYEGHSRFATALAIKGTLMVLLGTAALLWSEVALVNAMMLASLCLATLGLYEILLGAQARSVSRGWPIPVIDGAASVGLAVLSVVLTATPLATTLALSALWFGVNGVYFGAMALALWPLRRTRITLLGWAAAHLLLSGVAVSARAGLFTLLYAGAAYAIAFGAFQYAAALWVRRVAAPEVEPTPASRWRLASSR